ncbi:kinase-like domain-containing protein [Suillus spraguei]|nr:kinase-like domain-containing protein [Suillus spraguei]
MDDPTHIPYEFPPFYFLGFQDDTEEIEGYKPGGYHPVYLGDTFPSRDNPRYRILHKLGLGSMSTVWLAKDTVEKSALTHPSCDLLIDSYLGHPHSRCVTLKIVIANLSSDNRETAILQWLSTRSRDHPGAKHIVQLRDSFQIQGPNGTHQVLVMDVLGSLYSLVPQAVFHQQWSSEEVVHGDLHFGNIGFKIPGIDQYTEIEMYRLIGEPRLIPVLPHDHSVPSDSLPRYLVLAPQTTHYMPKAFAEILKDNLMVEIIDFGNAFRLQSGRPLKHPDMPRIIRPPELTFYKLSNGQVKDEWGLPSDVWSMACTIFEIAFADVMLVGGSDDDNMLIYETMRLIGPLPERWKPYWNSKHFEDSNGNFTIGLDAAWKERIGPSEDDDDSQAVVDLLRGMLCWEPMTRPTAAALLRHPWLAT